MLLDEACDSPVDMDWDSTVSEGEIPAVVYEAFDDYMTYKDVGDTPSHYDLSALLVGAIDHIIDICIFSNGRIQHLSLSYNVSDSLATAVQQIYEMGELLDNSIVTIEACDEVETLINFKNISMIQLPLAKIECDIKRSLSETDDA